MAEFGPDQIADLFELRAVLEFPWRYADLPDFTFNPLKPGYHAGFSGLLPDPGPAKLIACQTGLTPRQNPYQTSRQLIYLLKNNTILFIFITVCLDSMGLGIILPVLPDLLKEVMQVDVAKAAQWGGILAASYAVTQFLCGPLLGSLSDRFGRRPVLLIGLVALCVDYLIMGYAHTIWLLLAGRLLAGAAGSTFVTANAFIADVSPPEKRAANFGMVGAAFGVGFILGPIIGGLLGTLGTRAPFFAAAALALLNAVYGYYVLPETLSDKNRRSFSWAKSNPFSGLLLIRRFPALGWIFLSLFLYQIGHYVYPAIWAYWGQERFNWSPVDIGLTLAIVGVGFALVQGWLIRLVLPKLGETKTALLAYVITVFSLVFNGFVSLSWLAITLLPFAALGAMLTPAINGIVSNAVPEDEQGLLQGVLSGLAALSTIISPLLMTNIFYAYSNKDSQVYLPGAPFLAAAILCGLSMAAFIIGLRKAGNVDAAGR